MRHGAALLTTRQDTFYRINNDRLFYRLESPDESTRVVFVTNPQPPDQVQLRELPAC